MSSFIDYDEVLATYLGNLESMGATYQNHFCLRMFRITGDPQYLDILKRNLGKSIENSLSKLEKFDQPTEEKSFTEHVRQTVRRNPIENARIVRREQYYRKNYRFKQELDAINSLNKIHTFKLYESKYKDRIRDIHAKLKSYDWQKNFIKRNHLQINPVFFLNCIFYLKNLGIADYTEQLDSFIQNSFPAEKVQTEELLLDQVYIYTHLIINESLFYQIYLDKNTSQKYDWLFKFFDQNFLNIYRNLNLDLILEILLCYKLAGLKPPEFEAEAQKHLQSYYSTSKKMLKADAEATVEDMEHANILLLMYLKPPANFHPIGASLL